MLKLLFIVAIMANVILIVSSGTTPIQQEKTASASSSSSESSSSAHSSASASSSSSNSDNKGCSSDNDQRCGPNEQYSVCPDALCKPKTCAQLGFPISCPAQAADGSCPGKPGCICKDGYVRNCKGKCIPTSHCPSCGGDENAQAGCGVYCNRRCSDIGQKEPDLCVTVCYFNTCDCKDNYVLDDNTGKCVLPHQCTPTCGINEEFSNCTNGGCDARYCSQLGKPVPCVDLEEDACEKGCVCISSYLRADNGTCIPKSECPPACKEHEVHSDCINNGCVARNCSQLGESVPCYDLDQSACVKGCVCEEGYLRDCNGVCIPKEKCPNQNHDCPTNEVFDKCSYEGQCSPGTCDSIGKSYSCPAHIECKAECRCKKGYYRNELKQCISEKECSKCTGRNEVYDLCPYTCPPQTCEGLGEKYACPAQPNGPCKPACRCIPGFFRNKIGQCVSEKDCEPKTTEPPVGGCESPVTESPVKESALERFSEGNTDFTLNFLYQMIKKNPLASVVMSPFLVLLPLAELTLYTNPGESYDQLMSALNLNNKDEIRSVFRALLDSLKAQQNVTLDLGAKIYVNENYQLTDNFKKDTKDIFDAEAENVDFEDPDKAADIINAWVDEITRGLIKQLVTPNMFSEDTRLVLTNGIYFLGNWKDQFNADSTQDADFHVSKDKTIEVPMMYRKGSYKYTESSDLDCKIVELPYKGGNFSYVILLPNQIDGYSTLAEKIRDPNTLNKALDALEFQKCFLYAPRHEITSSIDLIEILNLLNITDLFYASKSNLSGILTSNESLEVTDAIQKAIIKFDEKGTEAAAVTGIVGGAASSGPPETVYEVRADHPFIFVLYQDRQPLFCGAYAGN